MNAKPQTPETTAPTEKQPLVDLAVFVHRVLILLRPLDAVERNCVLKACLVLNRSQLPASSRANEKGEPPLGRLR